MLLLIVKVVLLLLRLLSTYDFFSYKWQFVPWQLGHSLMLLTWFILFQFYDIKSLVNFSKKLEKLVKFRLQTQKRFPMFMSKNDTNCQKKRSKQPSFQLLWKNQCWVRTHPLWKSELSILVPVSKNRTGFGNVTLIRFKFYLKKIEQNWN